MRTFSWATQKLNLPLMGEVDEIIKLAGLRNLWIAFVSRLDENSTTISLSTVKQKTSIFRFQITEQNKINIVNVNQVLFINLICKLLGWNF